MIKIAVVGKRYEDTKLIVNSNIIGETNTCILHKQSLGGMYNFQIIDSPQSNFLMIETGIKRAFIVEDLSASIRTSYTSTSESSKIDIELVKSLEKIDWVHFAYLDDLDDVSNLKKLLTPYSIDFCTNADRSVYEPYLNMARVAFDSRERKKKYKNLRINTPIILHDEKGCEVLINGKIICEHFCDTLSNISVNGAGDIFAKFFIESHLIHGESIERSSKYALLSTTSFLKFRSNNEKI